MIRLRTTKFPMEHKTKKPGKPGDQTTIETDKVRR